MKVYIVWWDEPWTDPELCEIFESKDDATTYIKDKLSDRQYRTEAVHWTMFYIYKDLFKGKPSGREKRYWVEDHEVQSSRGSTK